jgi:hypothetical protein
VHGSSSYDDRRGTKDARRAGALVIARRWINHKARPPAGRAFQIATIFLASTYPCAFLVSDDLSDAFVIALQLASTATSQDAEPETISLFPYPDRI